MNFNCGLRGLLKYYDIFSPVNYCVIDPIDFKHQMQEQEVRFKINSIDEMPYRSQTLPTTTGRGSLIRSTGYEMR